MILDIMTAQKVMKMKTIINLTLDDIKTAIREYLAKNDSKYDDAVIKFTIKEVYQPNSLTGYYYPELQGATISVDAKEN
jgi:hypothetical protein